LRPFLKGVSGRRLQTIEETLRYSFVIGESSTQAARRLIGTSGSPGTLVRKSRRSVEVMARTSLNHIANTARRETYYANSALVSGYEWISTLDSRTTDICQYRDGRVWLFDSRARASYDGLQLEGEVYPPAHIGCRSTTAPITKSWRQLGLKGKDVPPSVRASASGEVPASMSYTDWLAGQSAAVQRDVLGRARYDLWKKGSFTIDQFYGKDGRFLTLDQLIRKSA
jgi:SPP1 gp7 family putative phage head morphogenesis protein